MDVYQSVLKREKSLGRKKKSKIRKCLVLDNHRSHTNKDVGNFIASMNLTALFCPVMTCDFNGRWASRLTNQSLLNQ